MSTPSINTDLVYGLSQSGKTTFCLQVARYLHQKAGLRSRWYLGDGGGETLRVAGALGASGFIDVLDYTSRKNPFEVTGLLTSGWWAQDPDDPESPLYKPSIDEMRKIGLIVWEGTTVMSDYLMGDIEGGLRNRMAKGEVMNNDASFRFKDGGTLIGGNSRTHYGLVQRHMLANIRRSHSVPAVHKYWTGHERRVDEESPGIRQPIIGPDVCGGALTARIGASFGNTIHLDSVDLVKKKKDPKTGKEVEYTEKEYRAYLRTHYDPNGATATRYFAGVRLPDLVQAKHPDFVPEYLTPPDPVRLFQILDEAEAMNKRFTDEATPIDLSLLTRIAT